MKKFKEIVSFAVLVLVVYYIVMFSKTESLVDGMWAVIFIGLLCLPDKNS